MRGKKRTPFSRKLETIKMTLNKPPINVLVCGLPGSGKSFFAERLASVINGLHISSDTTRQQLQQADKYGDQAKIQVYQEMLKLMEKAIWNKQNTVLDATFYKAMIRNLFKERAGQLNSPLYFIEMRADESTIRDRVSEKRKESEADFKVYLKIKSDFEPLKEEHLVLHSGKEQLNDMLGKALTYITYCNGANRN
jgi:predicted kinase